MNSRSFCLQPFPGEETGPALRIEGTIGRRGKSLSLRCAVLGDLSDLVIPSPAERPERRDRLWEETCLELFLAEKGPGRYWEFNLSPAGHWNVYGFPAYRKERREEPVFASLPFRVRTAPDAMRFSLDLEIERIFPAGIPIDVAVCAVIRIETGRTTHWALSHPGPRPDFHRRDSFTLSLPVK